MLLKAYVLLHELKGMVSNMVENDEAPYQIEEKVNEIINAFGDIGEIKKWTSESNGLSAI